jgi:hypothetical protein
MVRSVVRQMKKKTQQKSNKEEIGQTTRASEASQLNEEGQEAASKLLDMAQKWRASRWESRGIGRTVVLEREV